MNDGDVFHRQHRTRQINIDHSRTISSLYLLQTRRRGIQLFFATVSNLNEIFRVHLIYLILDQFFHYISNPGLNYYRIWEIRPIIYLHCALITLRPRGLRNSFAILATLKIFDWHWHWHSRIVATESEPNRIMTVRKMTQNQTASSKTLLEVGQDKTITSIWKAWNK